jgi:hypothetical protein
MREHAHAEVGRLAGLAQELLHHVGADGVAAAGHEHECAAATQALQRLDLVALQRVDGVLAAWRRWFGLA